jgi:hypothetical protein
MSEGFERVFGQSKLVLDPALGGAFLLSGHMRSESALKSKVQQREPKISANS